jgi:hypothetical protein
MRSRLALVPVAALCLAALALPLPSASASTPLAVVGPVAVADSVSLVAETTRVLDVLANDTYAAPAALSLRPVGQPGAPAHGVAALTTVAVAGGTRPAIRYTPTSGWYGSDSLRYALTDRSGLAASALVTIIVTPAQPVAVADVASVAPADVVTVSVLDNDTDPYGGRLRVTAVTEGAHGTAAVTGTDLAITYAPATGWSGVDTVTYTVTSASGASATAPVAVTTLPSSPGHLAAISVPASLVLLRTTTLTGAVSPYSDALPTVAVQTYTAAGWVTFAQVTPDSLGSFSSRWRPTRAGTVRWRTLAIWPDGTSATSPTASTSVVAVPDPAVSGPLARTDVPYSYRGGCPVKPASLRRLTITYWDYRGTARRGSIVLAASAVPAVRAVFVRAFESRFRIKRMQPVDAYYRGGTVSPTQSDISSMNAGNTSAYNCRVVTGTRYRLSQHSYGNAIDVNTYENPYATAARIYPVRAARRYYVLRSHYLRDIGVITPRSTIAAAFAARHWLWGARWSRHDYQHFSSNGG